MHLFALMLAFTCHQENYTILEIWEKSLDFLFNMDLRPYVFNVSWRFIKLPAGLDCCFSSQINPDIHLFVVIIDQSWSKLFLMNFWILWWSCEGNDVKHSSTVKLQRLVSSCIERHIARLLVWIDPLKKTEPFDELCVFVQSGVRLYCNLLWTSHVLFMYLFLL